MKKILSKLLKLRVKGESTFLATTIAIFSIIVLAVGLLDVYGELVKRNDIARVYRKYLLEMERDGYLTDAKETLMKNELTACGLYNIDITGTSKTAVGYGNMVRLVIKGDFKVDEFAFVGSTPNAVEGTRHVEMDRTGAALY